MTLNLKFEEKDFETLRTFDKAVKRQLGPNVYVGSDSLCFYFAVTISKLVGRVGFAPTAFGLRDRYSDWTELPAHMITWRLGETTQA